MRIRADGEETRGRILAAACEVFGERGYHKATFAEIGRRGRLNPALISFHFRSKEDLYRTVWQTLHERVSARWPADGGLPAEAPAEAHLRAHVRSTLNRFCDPDLEALGRIDMQERVNETGLLGDLARAHIRERRAHMRAVVRELLGPGATESDLDLCEMSITNQLFVLRPPGPPPPGGTTGKPPPRFTRDDIDRLVEHIARFSLAGLQAVRRHLAARQRTP